MNCGIGWLKVLDWSRLDQSPDQIFKRRITQRSTGMGWKPEPQMLEALVTAVPAMLSELKENGQFGNEPWTCGDQNRIYPLAAAWSLEESAYYHSDEVLDAIIKGGDALIDAQDEEGKWEFLKKD